MNRSANSPDTPFVFIVGSPRSGTTILGTIFDRHEHISQWYEPYFVWDRHFRDALDDVRSRADATPEVKAFLRKAFFDYRAKRGSRLVVDKSPRNSLKVPFIQEIFPNARFVHILRDGRDVTLSINREWKKRRAIAGAGKNSPGFDYQKAVRVVDGWLKRQPYMIDRVRAFWFETHGHVFNKKKHLNRLRWNGDVGWGPRFKNWTDIYHHVSLLEFNAYQWAHCVRGVRQAWPDIPEHNRMEIRYEDLITRPETILNTLLNFMGLEYDDQFLSAIPQLKSDNFNKWEKGFTREEMSQIIPILDPMLRSLGYGI